MPADSSTEYTEKGTSLRDLRLDLRELCVESFGLPFAPTKFINHPGKDGEGL
jgi:hypothetical protein